MQQHEIQALNHKPFKFENIPCEIRMLIYQWDFELYREQNNRIIPVYLRPGWWKQFNIPLLHVNKRLREEYLEILVKGVDFKFVSFETDIFPNAITRAMWPLKKNGQINDLAFKLMRHIKNITIEFSLPEETRVSAKESVQIQQAMRNRQTVTDPMEAKNQVIENTKKRVQSVFADVKLTTRLESLTVTISDQKGMDPEKRLVHPKIMMALSKHLRKSGLGTMGPMDLVMSFKVTK